MSRRNAPISRITTLYDLGKTSCHGECSHCFSQEANGALFRGLTGYISVHFFPSQSSIVLFQILPTASVTTSLAKSGSVGNHLISVVEVYRTQSIRMSSSQDAERSSRSPRRASFEAAKPYTDKRPDVASSTQLFPYNAMPYSMPSQDRIRYSNKESVKVNAGLEYGAWKTMIRWTTAQQASCTQTSLLWTLTSVNLSRTLYSQNLRLQARPSLTVYCTLRLTLSYTAPCQYNGWLVWSVISTSSFATVTTGMCLPNPRIYEARGPISACLSCTWSGCAVMTMG
jgi:hypothetical protein